MNENLKPETGKEDALGLRKSTGGVFDSVELLAKAISALSDKFNVVNPGGAVGANLPILYAGGVSFVFVDPEHETYPLPGRSEVGLGKTLLNRISSAAGVRWYPHLCGRVDDGRDANFVEYQVAGVVLQLDGSERIITDTKRIDLRGDKDTPRETWGADAQEIARVAELKKNPDGSTRSPWPQILQARQHILSLAETKAKNRAIRSLGVRTSYTKEELAKGFAVVRLQFTGRSDDPEIERMVAGKVADRALSSTAMLYDTGRRDPSPSPTARVIKLAAPVAEEDEPEAKKPEPVKSAAPATEAKAKEPNPEGESQAEAPKRVEPKDDPMLICGKADEEGNYPRKPCSQFSPDELRRKISSYEKKQPEWDPRWAKKNLAELNAMKAWLAYYEIDNRQGQFPDDADQVM